MRFANERLHKDQLTIKDKIIEINSKFSLFSKISKILSNKNSMNTNNKRSNGFTGLYKFKIERIKNGKMRKLNARNRS